MRCPYCHDGLGDSRSVCGICGTPHHPDCLVECGRCTVLGCPGPHLKSWRIVQVHSRWSPLGVAGYAALTVVALAAAVALLVPFLFPRRCCNGDEASAIGSLKAIGNAQILYREGDKDGDGSLNYATSLEQLTNTGTTGREDLIDEVLASGNKRGYAFTFTGHSPKVWTINANPTAPGTTGDRYFGTNQHGLVFFNSADPVTFNADGSSTDPVLGN